MANQPWGILPFGSTDDSVILQCTLTSLAAVQALGGTEPNANTNTFDPDMGLAAAATNGGVRFSTITGYADLTNAGQVSFEIESRAVCVTNATLPSTGVDWAGNSYAFVMREAGSTANYFRYLHDANERPFISWNAGGASSSTTPSSSGIEITGASKGQFTRITISWIGNKYDLYVNGIWVFTGNRSNIHTVNVAERIECMSGAGLGNAMVGVYMRNIIVSKRPVVYPVHRKLGNLCIVGHSFGERCKTTYTDFYRECSMGMAMRARLNSRGVGAWFPSDNSTVFASSGATVLRSGGNPLKTQVDLCVAAKPTAAIYIGGTNDAINASWRVNRAQTLADFKLDCGDILNSGRCEALVVCNVLSSFGNAANYAASKQDANVAEINADLATLPAWWDANNPTRLGQLLICDVYTLFSSSAHPEYLIQGSLLGNYTDLHPSAVGNIVHGYAMADTLMAAIT